MLLIEKIVDSMIAEGTKKTGNGSWAVYPDEIAREFIVSEFWVEKNANEIISELESRDAVAEVVFTDGYFDLMFWLSFCEGWDGTNDWGCIC